MVTPEQQIAQQRQRIAQARARARGIAEKKVSKRELLQRTLSKRRKARIEQEKREALSERELQKISKSEKEFEREVSSYETQKKKYQEAQKYNTAIKTIQRASKKGMVWAHAIYGTGIVKKLAREYMEKQKTYGGTQVSVPGKSSVSAPPGYWNEKLLEAHEKYRSQLSPSEQRLSQYEKNELVQQMSGYQQELADINALQETQESMVKFASSQGYARPQQYGKLYPISKPVFNTSAIKDIKIDFKPESQSYTTGRTTAPYGLGAGGTAIERPVTYQEQIRIQRASKKGRFEELPPVKFLGGEYEFQKKLDERAKKYREEQGIPEPEPKDVFGSEYTYRELAEKGAIPTMVRKASSDILGTTSIFTAEKITRTPIPEPYKTKTKETIGGLGLWFGFGSLISTGTYSKQKISKKLSEGKFEKLGKELGKLEKEVAEKATVKEQYKYLSDIRSKLKTKEEIEGFKKWVESLKEKEIIKPVRVDTSKLGEYKPREITGEIQIEIPGQIPVGEVGVVGIDPNKIRETKFLGESTYQTQEQSPFSINVFDELQQVKQEEKTKQKSLLGLKEKQVTKQTQPQLELLKVEQPQKTKQTTPAKELLSSLLTYKQRQVQQQRQVQRLKQPQKPKRTTIKTPIIPLLLQTMKKKKIGKEALEQFEVWVTKKGKEKGVGKFGTLKSAREELKEELLGTLRAGGGIKFKGKPLTFKEIGLFGGEFRPSKINPFKVIQQKEMRLGRKQEVKEIQLFKKVGGMNFI